MAMLMLRKALHSFLTLLNFFRQPGFMFGCFSFCKRCCAAVYIVLARLLMIMYDGFREWEIVMKHIIRACSTASGGVMFIPDTIARKERKVSYEALAQEKPKARSPRPARPFFGRCKAEEDVNVNAA